MKERPILFSGPMVRAILEGRKTQTRRVARFKPLIHEAGINLAFSGLCAGTYNTCDANSGWVLRSMRGSCWNDVTERAFCPYGVPGDRLWVREGFQPLLADGVEFQDCDYKTGRGYAINYPATHGVQEFYDCANDEAFCDRVTPSIHMPRWASRITLEIVSVRVERVQDISGLDCHAEGIPINCSACSGECGHYDMDRAKFNKRFRDDYRDLWDSINAKRGFGWDVNPWVWVISFKRLV